jgi:diadenosine tetraphosphate (Ap4A) HIT family hydrolase
MTCPLCDTLAAIGLAEHPFHIAELSQTQVILGENQGAPGWCVAILKGHVEHMAELSLPHQAQVFEEVARVAAALRAIYGPVRINYECLGNQVAHVHWHVIPRHADDPTPRQPVWGWSAEQLKGSMSRARRLELAGKIAAAISR